MQVFALRRIALSLGVAACRAGGHCQVFLTSRLNKLRLLLRSTPAQTLRLFLQRKDSITQRFVGRLQQLVKLSLLRIAFCALGHTLDLVVQIKPQLPQTDNGLRFALRKVALGQLFQSGLHLTGGVHDLRCRNLWLALRCACMRCFFQCCLYVGCTQIRQFLFVVLVRCSFGPFYGLKCFEQLVVSLLLDGSLTTRFNAVTHCAYLVLLGCVRFGYPQQNFFARHAQSCGQLRRFLGSDLLNRWQCCAHGNTALGGCGQLLRCTLFLGSSAALFAGTNNVLKQTLKFLGLYVTANDVAGFCRQTPLRVVQRIFGILVTDKSVQQRLCLLLAFSKSIAQFVFHKLRLLRISQINVAVAQTRQPNKRTDIFIDDAGVNGFVNCALSQCRLRVFQRRYFFLRQVAANALFVYGVGYAFCWA